MERMVNDRLVWYLEKNNLISTFQSGFRRGRSTVDHLIRFESFIRETFIKREHMIAVFFDLEKAYDTAWKYGIMKDLHSLGIRGHMALFIKYFLDGRHFKVRLGAALSDDFYQEQGVPQGSILSVTLFSIKINDIVKCVQPGVECSLYVDDFLISHSAKNIHTAERQLQQCLNKLQNWCDENGFRFSSTKTVCLHFTRKRGLHLPPALTLGQTPIPVVKETKFLGLVFDSKLTFLPHIKYLKIRCTKALNLLRVVANTDWGADKKVLLRLYKALVRSKLDYGATVYGSACKSYIKILDPVQNQGLRLCLGAFRTSPAESLCVEANEPPLHLRRKKLSLQFAARLLSNKSNPCYDVVFKPRYEELFANGGKTFISPFGIRIKHDLNAMEFDIRNISQAEVPKAPPWLLQQVNICYDLCDCKKSDVDPLIFRNKFYEVKHKYKDHFDFYTDGSKMGNTVACAVVAQGISHSFRLPNRSSIYSAELCALFVTVKLVREVPSSNTA
jgi:hypothetical protein